MIFEIGKAYTCWNVINLARQIHSNTEDFSEGNLVERIKRFSMYVLQEIPVSVVERGNYQLDEELIMEYVRESQTTQPPIIVTDKWKDQRDVIDGNHRVEAQVKRGLAFIRAFVPLDEVNNPNYDEEEEDEE